MSKRLPQPLFPGRTWFVVAAAVVFVFYLNPLLNPNTTPHWDAIDTHYSPQKYFADHVRQGSLPFWTPYLFSGFPFLADPQVGAWYPLNWPFFLVGITPRAIQVQLSLHALLAIVGAYLLILRMIASKSAALAGALCYGLSGFFAAHCSHVGMFPTA